MHPRFLTQRNETAQAATEKAAQALAERLGLPDEALAPLRITDRDPEVQAMLRREAVADLLAHVAQVAKSSTDPSSESLGSALASEEKLRERLIAIKGVGDALAQQILAVLALDVQEEFPPATKVMP